MKTSTTEVTFCNFPVVSEKACCTDNSDLECISDSLSTYQGQTQYSRECPVPFRKVDTREKRPPSQMLWTPLGANSRWEELQDVS